MNATEHPTDHPTEHATNHPGADAAPSPWVVRHADLVPAGRPVLDIACGQGRHSRFFLERGHPVTAVDIDLAGMAGLAGRMGLTLVQADLEGGDWPLAGPGFGGVIVTNYLWRPILSHIIAAVAAGGVLIYDTFASGQARFGRPTNPDHLLRPGELLATVRDRLVVRAHEHGEVAEPRPAMRQRIAAVNETS
jgi:SAM-dependent methyltransferase